MAIVLGIDIGGSATKIVGFNDENFVPEPLLIKSSDPVASLFGAFGKFATVNNIKLSEIKHIMITGVGASYLKENIYGIPTALVDEFNCIGLGGLYLSDLPRALVVSMGTGTAFVSAIGNEIKHLGGSGVGGGTLSGLARKLLGITSTENLLKLAEAGNLENIDLTIKDITTAKMSLPDDVTVSNFGKSSDMSTNEDTAIGILNLVYQSIGVMSYFASRVTGDNNIVLTGKLSTFRIAETLVETIRDLYGVNIIIPKNSEYATATGAALAYLKNTDYRAI